jgi:hypothetical protein
MEPCQKSLLRLSPSYSMWVQIDRPTPTGIRLLRSLINRNSLYPRSPQICPAKRILIKLIGSVRLLPIIWAITTIPQQVQTGYWYRFQTAIPYSLKKRSFHATEEAHPFWTDLPDRQREATEEGGKCC